MLFKGISYLQMEGNFVDSKEVFVQFRYMATLGPFM